MLAATSILAVVGRGAALLLQPRRRALRLVETVVWVICVLGAPPGFLASSLASGFAAVALFSRPTRLELTATPASEARIVHGDLFATVCALGSGQPYVEPDDPYDPNAIPNQMGRLHRPHPMTHCYPPRPDIRAVTTGTPNKAHAASAAGAPSAAPASGSAQAPACARACEARKSPWL